MADFIARIYVSSAEEIRVSAVQHDKHLGKIAQDRILGQDWPCDVYQNTGQMDEGQFICAVPTSRGLIAYFATEDSDADQIRTALF